jgi:hypothetical protein
MNLTLLLISIVQHNAYLLLFHFVVSRLCDDVCGSFYCARELASLFQGVLFS